jgi:hypothetical protein
MSYDTFFFTLVGLPLSYNTYRAFMKESELEFESESEF